MRNLVSSLLLGLYGAVPWVLARICDWLAVQGREGLREQCILRITHDLMWREQIVEDVVDLREVTKKMLRLKEFESSAAITGGNM